MEGETKALEMDNEEDSDGRTDARRCCSRLKPNIALVPLKAFYFLQLGGISTLFLYIPLYLDQELGLTKSEIAVTSFLAAFLSFFSRLMTGSLADRFQKFRLVLLFVVIGNTCCYDLLLTIPKTPRATKVSTALSLTSTSSNASLLCAPAASPNRSTPCLASLPPILNACHLSCPPPALLTSLSDLQQIPNSSADSCALYTNLPTATAACNLSCALLCPPTAPPSPPWSSAFWLALLWRACGYLLSTPTLCLADTITMALLEPHRRRDYGTTRLFGSLGFFVFSILTSAILKACKGNLLATFAIYTGQSLTCIAVVAAMRVPEGLRVSKSLSLLCISHEVKIFFLFTLLSGFCMAVIENYVFIAVKLILDPSAYFYGLMAASMVISETPVMAASGFIIAKIGELSCISLGFLCWALRFFVYSVMTQPWHALLNELLHGFTFAIIFPALVTYGSRLAPPGTEGTMQGMVSGVHLGLGVALGGLAGGVIFDKLGSRKFFVVCSVYSVVCAVALLLLQVFYLRRRQAERASEYSVPMTDAEAPTQRTANGHVTDDNEEGSPEQPMVRL